MSSRTRATSLIPVVRARREAPDARPSWGDSGRGAQRMTGWGGDEGGSYITRERRGKATGVGGILGRLAPSSLALWQRTLTPEESWRIYRQTADVRASVDAIVRRVATWDWRMVPDLDPRDPDQEGALEECKRLATWLAVPNKDGLTWQEVWTMVLTDLLVHEAGVFELAKTGRTLDELVPLAGPTVFPSIDLHNRVIEYVQDPLGYGTTQRIAETYPSLGPPGSTARGPGANGGEFLGDISPTVRFPVDDIVYLRLFPNTASPLGTPLLESLVAEVTALLLAADRAGIAFDADEVPPGLLVLSGISNEAAEAARQDFQRLKGKDRKIRMVSSSTAGMVDAKWVELRREDKAIAFLDVVKEIQRTVWRVFGVSRVEMGDTEDMPRAVGVVELDASQSHLIEPILELLEPKVNARILPYLVDKKWLGKIKFEFIRDVKETADEVKARREGNVSYVERGILTINEVRVKEGLRPFGEEGDIPLVFTASGPVPLKDVAFPPKPQPVPPALAGGGGGEGEDGSEKEPTAKEPTANEQSGKDSGVEEPTPDEQASDEGAPGDAKSNARSHRHGPDCGCTVSRTLGPTGLPSDWQAEGRFKGYRTLDLPALGRAIIDYEALVNPLYDAAALECSAAISDGHTPGASTPDDIQGSLRRVRTVLDTLAAEWATATRPSYEDTAVTSARQAAGWASATLTDLDEEVVRKRGQVYGEDAMRYLVQSGGLIDALRIRCEAIAIRLEGMTGSRAADPPLADFSSTELFEMLTPNSTRAEVEAAVVGGFRAEAPRIANWSGKLVELANQTMQETLDEQARRSLLDPNRDPESDPVSWYVEWVSVGDENMCRDCRWEGRQGFRPLSSLRRVPGQTTCRGRDRCVLSLWLKSEVDSGEAVALSNYG